MLVVAQDQLLGVLADLDAAVDVAGAGDDGAGLVAVLDIFAGVEDGVDDVIEGRGGSDAAYVRGEPSARAGERSRTPDPVSLRAADSED